MLQGVGLNLIKTDLAADSRKVLGAPQLSNQFGSFLNQAMNNLNEQQKGVDKLNRQFITGELADAHTLMIASEQLQLGLQLTVQVRNKVIEAYQEVMRMQI